jgi:hypothetical protein
VLIFERDGIVGILSRLAVIGARLARRMVRS